jgi:hypothetical protein
MLLLLVMLYAVVVCYWRAGSGAIILLRMYRISAFLCTSEVPYGTVLK